MQDLLKQMIFNIADGTLVRLAKPTKPRTQTTVVLLAKQLRALMPNGARSNGQKPARRNYIPISKQR